jgi:hypothetical protein
MRQTPPGADETSGIPRRTINAPLRRGIGGFQDRSPLICATTVCTACERAREKLVTHNFGTGTRGFAAPEDCSVAVCLLPGTELAFENPVKYQTTLMFRTNTGHTVAIFRQINKGVLQSNHDALEFPDGEIVLLTRLCEGQRAIVLTLPTLPKTAGETKAQQRVAQVG